MANNTDQFYFRSGIPLEVSTARATVKSHPRLRGIRCGGLILSAPQVNNEIRDNTQSPLLRMFFMYLINEQRLPVYNLTVPAFDRLREWFGSSTLSYRNLEWIFRQRLVSEEIWRSPAVRMYAGGIIRENSINSLEFTYIENIASRVEIVPVRQDLSEADLQVRFPGRYDYALRIFDDSNK